MRTRRFTALLAALLAVGAVFATAAPAQEGAPEEEIGLLFAQTASRGTMKPIPGTPRFNLRLRGVNSQVVWFSDRPARKSGHIPVAEFGRAWADFGFVEDPPNAALTLLHAGDHRDTVVMELGRPRFKRKRDLVRYPALLLDEATGDLSYLESEVDSRVNRRFRAPSLFIDDASAPVVDDCVIQPYTKCGGAFMNSAYLRGAMLSHAFLFASSFRFAVLAGADLSYADLGAVTLHGADVSSGAYMRSTRLDQANLTLTNLSDAFLVNANLRGVRFDRTTLDGAELRGANMSGATVDRTSFENAELCDTKMPDGSVNNRDC